MRTPSAGSARTSRRPPFDQKGLEDVREKWERVAVGLFRISKSCEVAQPIQRGAEGMGDGLGPGGGEGDGDGPGAGVGAGDGGGGGCTRSAVKQARVLLSQLLFMRVTSGREALQGPCRRSSASQRSDTDPGP